MNICFNDFLFFSYLYCCDALCISDGDEVGEYVSSCLGGERYGYWITVFPGIKKVLFLEFFCGDVDFFGDYDFSTKKRGVEELTIIRFRFLRFLLLRRYFLWNQYH